MAKTFATRIVSTPDPNGNSRRGWLVVNEDGETKDFVEEHSRGPTALTVAYPYARKFVEEVSVAPSEYKRLVKVGAALKKD